MGIAAGQTMGSKAISVDKISARSKGWIQAGEGRAAGMGGAAVTKRVFIIGAHPQSRANAQEAVRTARDGDCVTVGEATRSLEQNAAQWPILEAFSEQLEWPVNGRMSKLDKEDWKALLTAAFRQELARVAPGLDGGMVLLGARTSKFSKREFSDWLEFLHAAAADRGVVVYPEPERLAA